MTRSIQQLEAHLQGLRQRTRTLQAELRSLHVERAGASEEAPTRPRTALPELDGVQTPPQPAPAPGPAWAPGAPGLTPEEAAAVVQQPQRRRGPARQEQPIVDPRDFGLPPD